MSVNYTFIVQIISELMQEKAINKGASIVFISSISSIHFSVSNAAYSASKAALEAYANTLVLELAPQKIRVNIIRPGLLEGKMKDSYALDDSISNFVQKIPLKRLGTAQDISNMVMFLLSDKSSWMTGTTIDIDGGIKFI
jgi:NAD(P)-dependent dehydrogenase (short-subunit alcohol dehydrogenase family)